jgi:hypothetical protein
MSAIPFRTYKVLQWGGYIAIVALLCGLAAVFDIGLAVILLLLALLGAGFLYWQQSAIQSQLDRHGGSVPMRSTLGLLGMDITDETTPTPPAEPAATTEPPPVCPKCGLPSKVGELTCSRCGASLWTAPAATSGPTPSGR